jgi:hypothetical protein
MSFLTCLRHDVVVCFPLPLHGVQEWAATAPVRAGAWLPSPLLQEQELGERARLGMVDESKYQVPGMLSPAAATDQDGPGTGTGTGTGMGTGKGSKGKKTQARRKNSRRAAMTPEVAPLPLNPLLHSPLLRVGLRHPSSYLPPPSLPALLVAVSRCVAGAGGVGLSQNTFPVVDNDGGGGASGLRDGERRRGGRHGSHGVDGRGHGGDR